MMSLPEELFIHIFSYLSYDELMVTKDVNKRFRSAVQRMVRHRVVLIKDTREEMPSVYRPFGQDKPARVSRFLIGQSMINFKMNAEHAHRHLTRLVFYNPRKLFNLTTFDSLISLEIQLISHSLAIRPIKYIFKLHRLQRFVYNDQSSLNQRFVLDTPQLTHLSVNVSLSYFKIMHQNTIEELHCQSNISIESFVNVRTIHCQSLYYDTDRSLRALRSLESFFFYALQVVDLIGITEYFNTSENRQLAVYYRSIHFGADPLRSENILSLPLVRLKDHHLETYEANLGHVSEHLMQSELELSSLNDRSIAIIRKLTNLTALALTGEVRSESKWSAILRSPMLTDLQLKCFVPQTLLDRIPMRCRQLTKLEIHHFDNLNFVLKLHDLSFLFSNQFFEFNLLKLMLNRLRKLWMIRVNFYVIEIAGERVRCKLDRNSSLSVLEEPKSTFLQIIASINDWTRLFTLDDL